jgi:integrase
MVYSFARVGALVKMRLSDYYRQEQRAWFRLHEKGGKRHEVPAHHNAAAYVDAYLREARLQKMQNGPLFGTFGRTGELTGRPMSRFDVFEMIKRRARRSGLSPAVCCHTFRATGITAYLANGGSLEHAQAIAAHESPKTTKLYDRTSSPISLEEVEKIGI